MMRPAKINQLNRLGVSCSQAVQQRQIEWQSATDDTRDVARQRFLNALQVFTAFVEDGNLPDD